MITVRLIVMSLAFLFGVAITISQVKPLMEKLCLLGTNTSLDIAYQKYLNSALVHIPQYGYWFLFSGSTLYIFGEKTSIECSDDNHEPTFMADVKSIDNYQYVCMLKLEYIKNNYDAKASVQHIFHKIDTENTLTAVDVYNILVNNGVLY